MKPIAVLLFMTSLAMAGYENLWPAAAPGAKQPPAGTETTGDGGRLSNIEIPQYEVYLPEKGKANGSAVAILPGGGYGILAIQHEGHEVAKWLNTLGVTAIVVKYRVSGNPAMGYQYPVPLLDARRAIRTIRARASEWGVDSKNVGVLGFSAGGHLASLCATQFEKDLPGEGTDDTNKLSARPDFAILVYPVISMDNDLGHSGSRKNLLGEDADRKAGRKEDAGSPFSTDRSVSSQTPPVFLVTTSDDGVDCRNSLRFAIACKENKVPVTLHLFERGGHGYGLKGKGAVAKWPALLEEWLTARLNATK